MTCHMTHSLLTSAPSWALRGRASGPPDLGVTAICSTCYTRNEVAPLIRTYIRLLTFFPRQLQYSVKNTNPCHNTHACTHHTHKDHNMYIHV